MEGIREVLGATNFYLFYDTREYFTVAKLFAKLA